MTRRMLVPAVAGLALAAPALAVGLSPLSKEGLTAGPAKAFYLTVINPYDVPRVFRAYVDGAGAAAVQDEAGDGIASESRTSVQILPATMTIKPGGQRQIMVILRDLAPGETREERVCAELAKQEGMIHARVCAKLVARRIADRG